MRLIAVAVLLIACIAFYSNSQDEEYPLAEDLNLASPYVARIVTDQADFPIDILVDQDENIFVMSGNTTIERLQDNGSFEHVYLAPGAMVDADFSPDSECIVATAPLDQPGRILRANLETGEDEVLIDALGPLSSIAFAPGGILYAAEANSALVRVFDADWEEVRQLAAPNPLQIEVADDGNLFIASGYMLVKLNPETGETETIAESPGEGPSMVRFELRGSTAYVTGGGNIEGNKLYEIDTLTGEMRLLTEEITSRNGFGAAMKISSNDNFYLADPGKDRILLIETESD